MHNIISFYGGPQMLNHIKSSFYIISNIQLFSKHAEVVVGFCFWMLKHKYQWYLGTNKIRSLETICRQLWL